jgi:hypothetical protein
MYINLLDRNSVYLNKYIWKIKAPLKIRYLCCPFIGRSFSQKKI